MITEQRTEGICSVTHWAIVPVEADPQDSMTRKRNIANEILEGLADASAYLAGRKARGRTSASATADARKTRTDWPRLKRMTDAQIRAATKRDPDARPTDAAFWKRARLVMAERKK
jgi:hypothetical protein